MLQILRTGGGVQPASAAASLPRRGGGSGSKTAARRNAGGRTAACAAGYRRAAGRVLGRFLLVHLRQVGTGRIFPEARLLAVPGVNGGFEIPAAPRPNRRRDIRRGL